MGTTPLDGLAGVRSALTRFRIRRWVLTPPEHPQRLRLGPAERPVNRRKPPPAARPVRGPEATLSCPRSMTLSVSRRAGHRLAVSAPRRGDEPVRRAGDDEIGAPWRELGEHGTSVAVEDGD